MPLPGQISGNHVVRDRDCVAVGESLEMSGDADHG